MRGQVTLEALVVILALVTVIGLWVAGASESINTIRNELADASVRQAGQRVEAMCASAEAMGPGNLLSARVFVARDTLVQNTYLSEGWNNLTAEWRGQCLLTSTVSSHQAPP